MEQATGLSARLRLLLSVKAALVVGLVSYGSGLRPLDVAMWSVLCGIGTAVLLSLVVAALRPGVVEARLTAVVVLPESSAAVPGSPDPVVHGRAAVVDRHREALVDARQRGAEMPELLELAEALHEAELDLGRATLAAGGWVEPELRHELALRDRSATLSARSDQATR